MMQGREHPAPTAPSAFGGQILLRRSSGLTKTRWLGPMPLTCRTTGVARKLGISPATVHEHRENAKRKLDVSTRAEAVAIAVSLCDRRPVSASDGLCGGRVTAAGSALRYWASRARRRELTATDFLIVRIPNCSSLQF